MLVREHWLLKILRKLSIFYKDLQLMIFSFVILKNIFLVFNYFVICILIIFNNNLVIFKLYFRLDLIIKFPVIIILYVIYTFRLFNYFQDNNLRIHNMTLFSYKK